MLLLLLLLRVDGLRRAVCRVCCPEDAGSELVRCCCYSYGNIKASRSLSSALKQLLCDGYYSDSTHTPGRERNVVDTAVLVLVVVVVVLIRVGADEWRDGTGRK